MHKRLTTCLAAAALMLAAYTPRSLADEVAVPDELLQRVQDQGWSPQWHDELYGYEDPAVGAAVRQMLRDKRDAAALKAGLVVHEWGSMQHHLGTTTSTFDLIGEDQSDLPGFVNVWANQPALVPQIIRKPILYFYTQKKQKVSVTVRFPKGILTQWYPDATHFAPLPNGNRQGPQLQNGLLMWHQFELDPALDTARFAPVDAKHPWWHTARDTDATPIRVPNQINRGGQTREAVERFLFYRGAGNYTPMVMPKRNEPGKDLSVTVPFSQIPLRGVFLVRVNDSGATISHAPLLKGQATLELAGPEATEQTEAAAADAQAQLHESLEAAGLFPKEAAGLVKIWGQDMFTTPGERLIYIMPDNEIQRLLPLEIQPAPSQTVRTILGWVELSTPQMEKQITDLIQKLSSKDPGEAAKADAELRKLDHFAESILLRVVETEEDAAVKQRIQKILAAMEQQRRQGRSLQPR